MSKTEIWVLPFFGQGHLFPSIELCKHLAARNFKVTFMIASNLSSSVPATFRQQPLLNVIELSASPPGPPLPQQTGSAPDPMGSPHGHHTQFSQDIEKLLSSRPDDPPVCAITDVMMSGSNDVFRKFGVPTVGFMTSGAFSAAMECAMWDVDLGKKKPGEIILIPGLPEDVAITDSDLKQRPHGPPGGFKPGPGGPPGSLGGPRPHGPADSFMPGPPGLGPPGPNAPPKPMGGPGPRGDGPPKLGDKPPWFRDVEGSVGVMINTNHDLEGPFLDYISDRIGKPVWGVGPQLPEKYWKSVGSLIHDRDTRTDRKSNVTEDEVIQWLDSKPHGSVLYVSFGSEVGPDMDEYPELAAALEASNRPFIWVIQHGSGHRGPPPMPIKGKPAGSEDPQIEEEYFPHGLAERVGDRGLIIHGWAPQLLILSHPSTGGFLSHCGWNSTVEAIGRGVPILAWPIRGDQYHNAKLVVKHLKVGCIVSDDLSQSIKRIDIVNGIEKLLGDEDFKKQALGLRSKFEHGFSASSMAALDAFKDFITKP